MADRKRIIGIFPPWAGLQNGSFADGTNNWTDTGSTGSSPVFNTVSVNAQYGSQIFPTALHLKRTSATAGGYCRATSDLIRIQPNRKYVARAVAYGNPGTGTGVTLRASIQAFQSDGTTSITTLEDLSPVLDSGLSGFYELETPEIGFDNAYYVKVHLTQYNQTGTATIESWFFDASLVEVVRDLDDGVNYAAVNNTFAIQQGSRGQALAQRSGRYGGADVASEQQENDKVTWQALVRGDTSDEAVAACEAILVATERSNYDLALEWRAGSVLNSTFFPLRGPAEFELAHEAIRLEAGRAEYVSLTFPVAPLTDSTLLTTTIASHTQPTVITTLPNSLGTAPNRMDVAFRHSGGSAPAFCLLGWARRPTTPLASSVAPFGIIEAETGGNLSTWSASGTYTNYRGSAGIKTTVSAGGSASATFAVDPSTMEADDFTRGTIDVEVWARIEIDAGVSSPRMTLSLEPFAGTSFGAAQYTPEFGSGGKLLVNKPSSGAKFRPVRLGTLTLPVDYAQPLKWNIKVAASWAGGSGVFGLDYLVLVPARRRACTRTGVALDATYPDYIASTSDTNKLIRHDLSGLVASGSGAFGPDAGMGGSTLEPTHQPRPEIGSLGGAFDLLVWPSSVVPDDPVASSTDMATSHTSVTGKVYVQQRHYLVR